MFSRYLLSLRWPIKLSLVSHSGSTKWRFQESQIRQIIGASVKLHHVKSWTFTREHVSKRQKRYFSRERERREPLRTKKKKKKERKISVHSCLLPPRWLRTGSKIAIENRFRRNWSKYSSRLTSRRTRKKKKNCRFLREKKKFNWTFCKIVRFHGTISTGCGEKNPCTDFLREIFHPSEESR